MRTRASGGAFLAGAALWLSAASGAAWAQGMLEPFSPPVGRVVVSERSDFSRYENGAYIGHVYREARLDLAASSYPGGRAEYEGEALVFEETLRDSRAVARRLDGALPVAFSLEPGGVVRFSRDEGYPILRGFPDSPPESVAPGRRWTGEAVVVVRPRPGQAATRIPVLVEYEYVGATTYGGVAAAAIKARYAVRYKGGDRLGDPDMTGASGGRTADIVVSAEDGSTLFVRETIDETFSYAGGSTVRLKGFILHFHRGAVAADRDRIASMLSPAGPQTAPGASGVARAAVPVPAPVDTAAPAAIAAPPAGGSAAVPGASPGATQVPVPGAAPAATVPAASAGAPGQPAAFEVAEGERGVILLLYDLRFVADGDELLPGERGRLDAIAEALKRIPDRSFLVEGHTADLGRPAGQYELSERRARRIVDEMVARGIPASRFVYRGLGADEPIAPNDTEQNRARNRRVEITILD